jgi:diaminopropionate ammonia-lyase
MSQFFLNERGGPLHGSNDPGKGPISFHRKIPGYSVSHLMRAPAAARRLGVAEVLVKDESERFGLPSFKILGASWAVYRELGESLGGAGEEGAGLDRLTSSARELGRLPGKLVTATDGNHGRGVARVAAWMGIPSDIFVPADTARARIEAIESEGAAVHVVGGGYDEAVAAAASQAASGGWLIQDTAWEGYERIPARIVEGYSTIVREIEDQLESMQATWPDIVVVQIGVGSLAASVTGILKGSSSPGPARIVGVEPIGSDCAFASAVSGRSVTVRGPQVSVMAGLNCPTLSTVAWPVIAGGIDAFAAIEDEYAFEAVRVLQEDGIISGESGAAGLAGLLAVVSEHDGTELRNSLPIGPSSRILLISTEGVTDPDLQGPIT